MQNHYASWANSSALQLAGIDGSTQTPKEEEFCEILLGRLRAILIENASLLVDQVIPPQMHRKHTSLRNAQNFLFGLGIHGS